MRTLFLLLFLLSPDYAYAGKPQDVIPEQLKWLKKRGMQVVEPREVLIIDQETLTTLTGGNRQARGTCWNGVIYLSERLGFNTLVEQSLVLHELVHIQQNNCKKPRTFTERADMEAEAYQLQSDWHEEKTGRPLVFPAQASLRAFK